MMMMINGDEVEDLFPIIIFFSLPVHRMSRNDQQARALGRDLTANGTFQTTGSEETILGGFFTANAV